MNFIGVLRVYLSCLERYRQSLKITSLITGYLTGMTEFLVRLVRLA
ncbi:Uncharacterised protein [Enterobacter hormaechei]|nr:Uncharacterised protein [Enterobacter hormaechei]SAG34749.1 Uncharacterised protein [Enterobacter kobei]CZX42934.1 Uncharacterised protein [Enterobacter hormaechei]CZY52036.1 Uncharacterised protein [Enterobacter hormaechei]SAC22110.1 Uncharacterised protein [Enterobacter hormaechei]